MHTWAIGVVLAFSASGCFLSHPSEPPPDGGARAEAGALTQDACAPPVRGDEFRLQEREASCLELLGRECRSCHLRGDEWFLRPRSAPPLLGIALRAECLDECW